MLYEVITGEPVVVSIFGGTPEEFGTVASWFPDAAAFELNLSCPHAEGYGASIGVNPRVVRECTEIVKTYNKPVWVKLRITSYNVCYTKLLRLLKSTAKEVAPPGGRT